MYHTKMTSEENWSSCFLIAFQRSCYFRRTLRLLGSALLAFIYFPCTIFVRPLVHPFCTSSFILYNIFLPKKIEVVALWRWLPKLNCATINFKKDWIVDSNCSHHSTRDDTKFSSLWHYDGTNAFIIADNIVHSVDKEGIVVFKCKGDS